MYKIDDELDRKVDHRKGIFGHFPANRFRVSEKAIVWDVNDGILRSIRWNEFLSNWESDFKPQLEWYIRQIVVNTVIAKAKNEKPKDQRLRRMQHQLVDLVDTLDAEGILKDDRPSFTWKYKTSSWCDGEEKRCKPGPNLSNKLEARTRRERHDNFYGSPQPYKESTAGVTS